MTTSTLRWPEGWRIKHTLKRNSIKVYDKASVLRVETTINTPREFKVLLVTSTAEGWPWFTSRSGGDGSISRCRHRQ